MDETRTEAGAPSSAQTATAYGQSPPVPVLPPELVDPLRRDLSEADYTVEGITAALGDVAAGAMMRGDLVPARRVIAGQGGTPLAVLLRLFALGDAVDEEALATAFPRTGAAGVRRVGLVAGVDTGVVATCDLRPYGDESATWWIASDLGEITTGRPLHPDHVLGVGGASLTLAAWTPRIPARRILDLGTGCGIQALHAAAQAQEIVATDLSERALAFAAFTAALAQQRWDLRRGDLFEPVATGEPDRFDLVVSNPPFVVSPRAFGLPVYEYRDGGRPGDTLVESFVRGVGRHLTPGGLACFLANWEVGQDADWRDRWRTWLATPECAGLDAWVLARERQDVAEYAETWARDGGHRPGSAEHDRWIEAWLEDFESRGVQTIWFGIVFLQRPVDSRSRWIDLTEATGAVESPMGPAIARGLAARTRLHDLDDDALFATTWVAAPDVTEERHTRPGEADPDVIVIRQGGGLRRVIRADTALAAFVSVCDGELAGDVAITAIAALTGVEPEVVRAAVIGPLRELVADGLLVPAPASGPA